MIVKNRHPRVEKSTDIVFLAWRCFISSESTSLYIMTICITFIRRLIWCAAFPCLVSRRYTKDVFRRKAEILHASKKAGYFCGIRQVRLFDSSPCGNGSTVCGMLVFFRPREITKRSVVRPNCICNCEIDALSNLVYICEFLIPWWSAKWKLTADRNGTDTVLNSLFLCSYVLAITGRSADGRPVEESVASKPRDWHDSVAVEDALNFQGLH